MTIANIGDVVSYDAGEPGIKNTAQGVTLMTPGSTAPLGTASNPLMTGTSALQTTPDLTNVVLAISTATTTVASSAVASQKTRVYRMRLNTAAANVITILNGATTLEVLNFTGAGFLTYDFATRPWYTTATNAALNITTSAAVAVNVVLEITKVA